MTVHLSWILLCYVKPGQKHASMSVIISLSSQTFCTIFEVFDQEEGPFKARRNPA